MAKPDGEAAAAVPVAQPYLAQPAPRRLTLVAALMFSLSVIAYFDRTVMSIAGPVIMKEFGIGEVSMGTVYSAFLASYALLMIPLSSLADRFGPKRLLAVSTLAAALFTGLTTFGAIPGLGAVFGVVPALVMMRVGLGVAQSPVYPTFAKMNANWSPLRLRGTVQGVINCGAGLGGAFAPLIFGWLIAVYGWRTAFLAAGMATFVIALFWIAFVSDSPSGSQRMGAARPRIRWGEILRNRQFLLLVAGYVVVDYFEYIFFYWIYFYLGEVRKLNAADSSFYTTLLFMGFFLMTPVGGWLLDRFSARYGRITGLRIVGAGGLLLSSILLIIGANTDAILPAVIFMALALGSCSCSDVTFWSATLDVAGDQAGAAGGILNAAGNAGGFVAPILTPLIAVNFGWKAGLYFGSALALLGMLIWFVLKLPEPHQETSAV